MEQKEIEALLVIQKMDIYYLSGTTQDGLLYIPLTDRPLLLVRREMSRAKIGSGLEDLVAIRSLREIPMLVRCHYGRLPESLEMELDVLPFNEYCRCRTLFPESRILDASVLTKKTPARSNPPLKYP